MFTKRIMTAGQICPGILVQIAERGRQAVAAMSTGAPAQRPQRILQACGKSDITFAAQETWAIVRT